MSSEETLPFKQRSPFYHQELSLGLEPNMRNLSLWLSDFYVVIRVYYSQIKMFCLMDVLAGSVSQNYVLSWGSLRHVIRYSFSF